MPLKFTERGSVRVFVELIQEGGADKLAFVVQDTGCGIPKDEACKLFAPFAQAGSRPMNSPRGTGLGLVLARKLAQGLGGNVELTESTMGLGSTFTITIDPGNPPDPSNVPERHLRPRGRHLIDSSVSS